MKTVYVVRSAYSAASEYKLGIFTALSKAEKAFQSECEDHDISNSELTVDFKTNEKDNKLVEISDGFYTSEIVLQPFPFNELKNL